MTCLLCGQHLGSNLTFRNLLFLKKEAGSLCFTCSSSFEKIGEEHCPTCYKAGVSTSCQDCQLWCKEGIDVSHEAIFTYNQAMKDYFSRYKFDGDYILRKIFASILKDKLRKYKEFQILLIPLSPERFSKRGFNQVEGLIETTGLSYLDLLGKSEVKASSSKNRSERLATELPFFIKNGVTIPKKILLIDDIYTTGATVNRVKSMLENAGAEEVAKVEVTIPLGSITLRAEDVSQDMYGSIDLVTDKIERQIRKNKTKIERKNRNKVSTSQLFTDALVEDSDVAQAKVVRSKHIDLKPMDLEEALLQMDLLGHDFFIYIDVEDETTNVIYRREDGDIGLLEAKES